jgi:uncharacterized membrane protein (DUF2068 family)
MVKKKSGGSLECACGGAPEGVRIIGVLYFVGALIALVFGALLLSFSDSVSQNSAALVQSGVEIPDPSTLIYVGVALLVLSVLEYLIARGLFRLKNWARVVVAVLSVLGVVSAIMNLKDGMFASGIFSLVANGLIVWYLMFRAGTRKAFK